MECVGRLDGELESVLGGQLEGRCLNYSGHPGIK